jgi:hypothetical protein
VIVREVRVLHWSQFSGSEDDVRTSWPATDLVPLAIEPDRDLVT